MTLSGHGPLTSAPGKQVLCGGSTTCRARLSVSGALCVGAVGPRLFAFADPEACRAHKREKWLAGELDPVGDCLFEDLLSQCDTSLIHGGHGISECGSCTHMSDSAKVVGHSKLKRPLPESFAAGSMLSVSCGTRFAGLNRFGNEPLSEQQIVCQDGAWVDPHGGPGLLALQCVACVRATPRAGSSLQDFMAASQQERWWLQHHPVEIRSWDNLCLSSEILSDSSVTISFTDPVDIAVSSRRRNIDTGGIYGSGRSWRSGYSYGWTGDGGTCAFDQQLCFELVDERQCAEDRGPCVSVR
ncbi:unnamed protein product [Symbiodinium microadriaticum]|nr:unnamed protein product [Symbiodinium microadriaticum]